MKRRFDGWPAQRGPAASGSATPSRTELRWPSPVRPDGRPLPLEAPHGWQASPLPWESDERPEARGKFLYAGTRKLYVRGFTYGTFRPGPDGDPFPEPAVVRRDFAAMADAGANAVRTYTPPPRWLLDEAGRHGLRVMAGVPWEQHVTFLDDRKTVARIRESIRRGVSSCAGHPAVLCHTIGNEIPGPIVRWHGRRRTERFLESLYDVAKDEDPDGLVTYVNYPTTEFLELPFLDLVAFNVYLEARDRLEAYLARLHNLVGDRPLVMAEVGMDRRSHGERVQAESVAWQVETAFTGGCAGAFVFAWTDEWHRGGHEILDWEFGVTTRDREPLQALEAVERAFADAPVALPPAPPRISVVVCTYNGSRTVAETLTHLERLPYPDYEIIVVDDGSTDGTPEILRDHDVKLIRTENRGLSSARNTGLEAASGEIVAYMDDDAYPDPHWLHYLAHRFQRSEHVGLGGPNVAPVDDPPLAHAVANAPGGPTHVLVTDEEAEHIPGCNMAFRKEALEAIGGFDPRFRTAGDDVDVCWRLQEAGGTLGFHPSALVWHHRRPSLRTYWKQQVGYGRAEALLEEKWPEKYNAAGHYAWQGRVYGPGLTHPLWKGRSRIYFGPWGSAPFQSLYSPAPGTWFSLPLMPEWYLLVVLLAGAAVLGGLWAPLLLWSLPLLALVVALPVAAAVKSAWGARPPDAVRSRAGRLRFHAATAFLHIVQPVARLRGRLGHGLTPWRNGGTEGWVFPWRRERTLWSEVWRSPVDWVSAVEEALRARGVRLLDGGPFDTWDLEVRGGLLGSARLLSTVEEHGEGRQLVRFLAWPRLQLWGILPPAVTGSLAAAAAGTGAWIPGVVMAVVTLWLLALMLRECGAALATLLRALQEVEVGIEPEEAAAPGEEEAAGTASREPAIAQQGR